LTRKRSAMPMPKTHRNNRSSENAAISGWIRFWHTASSNKPG
jgi:hypothetical protein